MKKSGYLVCRHICGYTYLYKSQIHFGTMREMDKKIKALNNALNQGVVKE